MSRPARRVAALTARQLKELTLPALPKSRWRIAERAAREGWPAQPHTGRGGGVEYAVPKLLEVLPKPAAAALRRKVLPQALRPDEAEPAPQTRPTELKSWQRRTMQARLALVHEVQRLAHQGRGLQSARVAVSCMAAAGELPPHLQKIVPIAVGRASDQVSIRSLRRWQAALDAGGEAAVAPSARDRRRERPAWWSAFKELYARPGKPSISACYEKLAAQGVVLPSLRQVQHEIRRLGAVERQRGRVGPRELKNVRPYVVRTIRDLLPGDVFTADGHTSDIEVISPETGRPFRPEIVSVIDVRTRRCVGWSAGVAESAWLVADALRNAASTCIPAIFYTDRGPGFINAHLGDAALGVLARLGVSLETALPYNSQARGVVERFHQSCWVRGARFLPSFVGKGMDNEARKRLFKKSRAEIELSGGSRALLSWPDFLAWCQDQIDVYNDRPHRTLRQSPAAAWAAAIEAGFKPETPDPGTLDDLFRSYVVRRVDRCTVRLFDGRYFARELEDLHGETVLVSYDIHDVSRVWVRDAEQRLVAIAELDGNARPYFPKSAVERAREKRAAGQLARLEAKKHRLGPPPKIVTNTEPDPEDLARWREAELAKMETATQAAETGEQRYLRWLTLDERARAGRTLYGPELTWWKTYRETPEARSIAGLIDEYGSDLILGSAIQKTLSREPAATTPPAAADDASGDDDDEDGVVVAIASMQRPLKAPAPSRPRSSPRPPRRAPVASAARIRCWKLMRERKRQSWSWRDLAAEAQIVKRAANAYIKALLKAGYLTVAKPPAPGGVNAAEYLLVKDTGDAPPIVEGRHTLFDPNTGERLALVESDQRARGVA